MNAYDYNFTHELDSYAVSTAVIVAAIITVAAAIIYGVFSTRIVAGHREIRHLGDLKPNLKKKRWMENYAGYRESGDGDYAILFSSTTTDGFMASVLTLGLVAIVVKEHFLGIYQLAMNIDGTYLADFNGLVLAVFAIMLAGAIWWTMLYSSMHVVQILEAIRLTASIRKTGEFPYYIQRRSAYFFVQCMKYGTKTEYVRKRRRATVVAKSNHTVAASLSPEERYRASMQGYYVKHPPVIKSKKHITMTRCSRIS